MTQSRIIERAAGRLRGRSIAVVGGGISGLAAAFQITRDEPTARVTIIEASERLGGVIATLPFAGVPVETGPDAFLARVPDAANLCREIGLGDDLVAPRSSKAFFWSRGKLVPIPAGTVLGMPADFASVAAARVLSAEGLARASLDLVLPRTQLGDDPSVGELVTARFGREVLERLVDPLLGGVYAGRSDELSARAVVPDAWRLAVEHRSLSLALRAHRKASARRGPVFLTVRGGLERIVGRLRSILDGCDVRTGVRADVIDRGRNGYQVRTPEGVPLAADAVIVATQASAAAELLRELCPAASRDLDGIEYASVATVTLGYRRGALHRPLDGAGFLVPRADGRMIVGCTWMTSKWADLAAADRAVLRCSVGRAGDDRWLGLSDEQIVAAVHAELVEALGVREPPVESRVARFERSIPQYVVGHHARLARIDAALANVPGIALAGSGYRGIGLPACIASGRTAATQILGATR